MNNHTYGEIFEGDAPRLTRPSRSAARSRPSYNENLLAPNIGERDDGDAHPSTFQCYDFLRDAGILEDFLFRVDRVGLTTYMNDESPQYAILTKTFVESFTFNNHPFKPSVAFKIYDKPHAMTLIEFCWIIDITSSGTA